MYVAHLQRHLPIFRRIAHTSHSYLIVHASSSMFQFSCCLVHAVWLNSRASCPRIHTSLLIRHLAVLPSSFMPFCSYLIAHTSLLLPHCHHSSYFIGDVSFLTPPCSCLLVHTVVRFDPLRQGVVVARPLLLKPSGMNKMV